jgi:hypothetical protein
MVRVTADDSWLLKDLGLFVEPVEVSDATGKLLGLFVPANLERGKQLYAKLAAQTDWAEIERRKATEKGGRPLWEVFERLKTLTEDPATQAYLQRKIEALKERDRCGTP